MAKKAFGRLMDGKKGRLLIQIFRYILRTMENTVYLSDMRLIVDVIKTRYYLINWKVSANFLNS